MRQGKRQLDTPLFVGLVLALTVGGASGPAHAQTSGYELCIEYSPAKAGTVTPDTGTHRFSPNSIVTLSADPKPGYHFAYWIGDVSNPKAPNTTVRLDTSKIVVAVFKPAPIKEAESKISIGGGGGGGGSFVPTKVDLSSPAFSISAGGAGAKKVVAPAAVIVTPEPATILLLGLGTFALRRRRR